MDSKVRHGPHDRFLLIEKPDILSRVNAPGLRTAMGKICLECDNISNQSAFYQFSGLSMGFCKPLVVAYHQKTPCFLRGPDHILALLQTHRHRLLTEYVFSCLQSRNRNLRMDVICHADTYRVDFPVGQKFLIGIKRFSPIPDGQLFGPILI